MKPSELSEHFRSVADRLDESRDELLAGPVRDAALQGIRANFNSSAGPDGRNWPARKNPGDGHPLLVETGALMQAATGGGVGHVTEVANGKLTLAVDTSVDRGGIPAAALHNKGAGKMPQREFMGVSEERLDQSIDPLIADAGMEAFDNG